MKNVSASDASGQRHGSDVCANAARHNGAVPAGVTLSQRYASHLLRSLGVAPPAPLAPASPTGDWHRHAAIDWAQSGLMWLSGAPGSPPLRAANALPSCARGAILALQTLLGHRLPASLDGARLLTERSSMLGFTRGGKISANGSCQLLEVEDGTIALNMARAEDWSLLPAWLEVDERISGWDSLARVLAPRPVAPLVSRGRLLGLPIAGQAQNEQKSAAVPPWFRVCGATHAGIGSRVARRPLVVDLSSLWAGPLCSHLLATAGARVIKVESVQRPDASRTGAPEFFDLLHSGKESVLVDLDSSAGRDHLRQLLTYADIVIESSRPRALQQLGIDAAALVAQRPGMVWLSLTGYGRSQPQANWVAFGDDASVAAGLWVDAGGAQGGPYFSGDALCDPLAGMHAAVAALAFRQRGKGALLDINLCDVALHSGAFFTAGSPGEVLCDHVRQQWYLELDGERVPIRQPGPRRPQGNAARLGRDTGRVLCEVGSPC